MAHLAVDADDAIRTERTVAPRRRAVVKRPLPHHAALAHLAAAERRAERAAPTPRPDVPVAVAVAVASGPWPDRLPADRTASHPRGNRQPHTPSGPSPDREPRHAINDLAAATTLAAVAGAITDVVAIAVTDVVAVADQEQGANEGADEDAQQSQAALRRPHQARSWLHGPAAYGPLRRMTAAAWKSFLALLVIVDPVAVVPLFLVMTAGDDAAQRRRMAARAAVVAGTALAIFAAVGDAIFLFLGISLGAFRIAGGVLLFLLAVDMLLAKASRQRTTPEETAEGTHKPDVSVFPLAIPMLAGPGSITVVMMSRATATTLVETAMVFVAIAVVAVVSWLVLREAGRIERRLGQTGMNVLHRVFGLLLAAIAAQFVVDGVRDAFFVPR